MTIAVSQIAAVSNDQVIEHLEQALAETAVATLKTQNFHWNVTGMAFGTLHALFGTIYEDLFAAQDELAERIRSLDRLVDGRMARYLERAKITEALSGLSAQAMVQALAADQQILSHTLLALAGIAEAQGDLVTQDMAIGRAQVHDKFAWMLRAHLAD